ncbi:MAG: hypothetical protein PHH11_18435 [Methylomonas sp.]|nr:hypothetical protein [Methylomonas sp.]
MELAACRTEHTPYRPSPTRPEGREPLREPIRRKLSLAKKYSDVPDRRKQKQKQGNVDAKKQNQAITSFSLNPAA